MTAIALHTPPRWRTVAVEQIVTLRQFLRRTGLLVLVLYGAGLAVCIRGALVTRDARDAALQAPPNAQAMAAAHLQLPNVNFTYSPAASAVIALLAFLLPFGVWQDEDPRRRSYHWMMPLPRQTHTLTKVFAGWVWLMAATALYLLFILATVAITERITGEPQLYPPTFAAWEWLVPFTVGTIAYMFSSAATVGSRQPIAWIIGVIALYAVAVYLLTVAEYPEAARRVTSIFSGEYGAAAAMLGRIQALDAVKLQRYSSLTRWLGASVIWGAIGATLLVWTSYRRPE
ncbi:MAG: hypothetical protein ABI625_06920 [bacterium]